MKKAIIILISNLFLITQVSLAQLDSIPVHQSFKIESKTIGETRTINVWTPPEYNSTHPLPVLYMLDGGLKEDFPHIANTLAELIAAKKIAPIILVGIENTQRRRDLTGPTEVKKDKKIAPIVGGSKQFRDFINYELFAEINKQYKTTPKKGIIGESLAGLFVTETFLLTPDMFDFYIAFDPSLWWNNKKLVRTAELELTKFPKNEKRFWFASSNTKDISKSVYKLSNTLTAVNLRNLKWHFSDEPKENHNTIFRATKEKAILWTLGVE